MELRAAVKEVILKNKLFRDESEPSEGKEKVHGEGKKLELDKSVEAKHIDEEKPDLSTQNPKSYSLLSRRCVRPAPLLACRSSRFEFPTRVWFHFKFRPSVRTEEEKHIKTEGTMRCHKLVVVVAPCLDRRRCTPLLPPSRSSSLVSILAGETPLLLNNFKP